MPAPPAGGPQAGGRGGDLGPVRSEITGIVLNSVKEGQVTLSPTDHAYIGSLIAQRTGLSQQDAEKRLDDVIAQAKAAADEAATKARQAADDARKAGALLRDVVLRGHADRRLRRELCRHRRRSASRSLNGTDKKRRRASVRRPFFVGYSRLRLSL